MAIDIYSTRAMVETVLRQLKGFVPKGKRVEFKISYDDGDFVTFKVVQIYDEEDQLPPETSLLKL